MANGIYSAAAGMAAQQARLDAIANDIANESTTGYKAERIGFRDLLYGTEDGVAVGTGAAAVDAGRSQAQGVLHASDNPLALAIEGPGYFQVKGAGGTTALTRDGDFQLDANGSLVTSTGEQLVPPVRVPKGTQPQDVKIAADGTVTVGTQTIGAIKLVNVPAPAGLQPLGSSMFAVTQASGGVVPASSARLHQGELEASNVDLASEMSAMLEAQNDYQLASRAIQTQDQMLQIANGIKR